MKSYFWILFLLILTISCRSSSHVHSKQILHINIQSDPMTLDPRKARDLNSMTIIRSLFEGLTAVGKDGSTELAMAQSVDVSEDGRIYTFHLREAAWSNHEMVSSVDFAESWRKTLDPSFPTDLAYQLYVIKGAKGAKLGESSLSEIKIQTPDPRTLVVELEQPTPYFLELLTLPSFFPVCHRLDVQNPSWSEHVDAFVSNGPFVLSQWKHSDRISVVRNPAYWNAQHVRLRGIDMLMIQPETELRMFMNQELDWAGSPLSNLPPDALAKLKQNKDLMIQPLTGTFFIRVNTQDAGLLSQPSFRRALARAIDREKIAEHILQGGQLAATALVPPVMGLSSGYFSDFSKETSQYISEKAITLLFVAGERSQLIAEAIQQQIESVLGVPIQLEAVERKMLCERIAKKQYQLATGSWIADFNDPINFLEVFKYKDGGPNNTGWEDPKYIERLNSSAVCKDPEERKQILRDAEKILMEQMPIIPIFHFSLNYLQREGVKDVSLSPIGQIDFRWCTIDTIE